MIWLLLAACGPDPVTWHGDVAPIVATECAACHQDGGIAPFALETYDDVVAEALDVHVAVEDRVMPPFGVTGDGTCGTWRDDRWLSDEEIDTLTTWLGTGLPAGDEAPPPERAVPERIETPDAVLDIGVDFVPTIEPDEYRCFLVDPGLDATAFLTGWEVVPGNTGIVHHVIVYTLDSAETEAAAVTLDEADEVPGYTCFGSSVVPESRPIAAWAPGSPATRMPEGTGIRLAAGRRLVLQVHYSLEHAPGDDEALAPDRTTVRLELEPSVPTEAFVYLLADLAMRLPPGEPAAEASYAIDLGQMGLPLGVFVRGVFPHMHRRGVTLRAATRRPGAPEACLADVPRWDFDWQQLYFLEEPRYLFPDEVIEVTCTFDTTDDTAEVTWGEGTGDEMCLLGLLVTLS